MCGDDRGATEARSSVREFPHLLVSNRSRESSGKKDGDNKQDDRLVYRPYLNRVGCAECRTTSKQGDNNHRTHHGGHYFFCASCVLCLMDGTFGYGLGGSYDLL